MSTGAGGSDAPALPAHGEVSAGIAAAPGAVWVHASDPSVPARFSGELQEAHVDGGGAIAAGAVIVGRNARGAFEWTTRSRVMTFEPPWRLAWATGDPPAATWSLSLESAPGGTVLRHAVTLHEGREPLAGAIAREPARARAIVAGRLAELLEGMARTVEGIAALAEGRDPPLPGA